jgi:hypothetical protein
MSLWLNFQKKLHFDSSVSARFFSVEPPGLSRLQNPTLQAESMVPLVGAFVQMPPAVALVESLATTTSFVSSPEDVMDLHCLVYGMLVSSFQFTLLSEEFQMDVMADHCLVLSMLVSSSNVVPLLVEVQMLPLQIITASFVPSSEDVMEYHILVLLMLVSSVHAAPLLAEVQMVPRPVTAASFVPSSEDVIVFHMVELMIFFYGNGVLS